MFKKAIESVILDGEKRLEELKSTAKNLALQAQEEVDKRKSEIRGLMDLAKNVPENVFGRFETILIGQFDVARGGENGFNLGYSELRMGPACVNLADLQGNHSFSEGKYRAVVLFEKIK